MLASKFLSAAGGEDKLYVDDVFSAYTRTGTGADVTVTTGIDMTKGYMLWSKSRSGTTAHAIYDSSRGVTLDLASNTTAAQTTQATGLKAVSATGHTVGSLAKINTSAATYVDWVFRKAPKFFDVVTYTGDGVAPRALSHALGIRPGMVVIKSTSVTGSWWVTHRAGSNQGAAYPDIGGNLYLNATSSADAGTNPSLSAMSASTFTLSTNQNSLLNVSGVTYVAYLFAHDPSADGVIQCGSYTGNGSAAGPTVNLGYEPQYLMIKNASGTGNWQIMASMRGMSVGSAEATLQANLSAAETAVEYVSPTATGFQITSTSSEVNTSGSTYIYMAIRRPNKPPTTGTQVYNAIARTGTGAAATVTGVGFAPDLVALRSRSGTTGGRWIDRLRGATAELIPESTAAETAVAQSVTSFDVDGFSIGTDGDWNTTSATYINHFFRRAPGVFDVVCYKGTDVAKTERHNLGVAPELIIVKARSTTGLWSVYAKPRGATNTLFLNQTSVGVSGASAYWNNTEPTASVFSIGGGATNFIGDTLVAYLFATSPGISKVGSYTGNGSSQTINCGFTTGARFVLIKRTDAVGDWYVWDTSRGIVAGNDPHLSLNSAAAEVTTNDSIDPASSGFIVNQVAATNINVNAASYIYLSFA